MPRYTEGEWQALLARLNTIEKELKGLKYDLLLWAAKDEEKP
jgi:hypothetical protein